MTVQPKYCENKPSYIMELAPFARFNWKTRDSKEMLKELLIQFESGMHEAEWRSVLDDRTDREAAIIHITNTNRDEWLERVSEYGLYYKPIRYSQPYDGFAHRHIPADPYDPNRMTYAVVAANEDVAQRVKDAELNAHGKLRHDIVGEALGFPECCRKRFADIWVDEYNAGLWDPIYEIACNTPSSEIITDEENIRITDPDAYTNVMWRYFGWSFITHFPCSFECEESRRIGVLRHELMKENGYEEAAEAGYRFLDEPHVWEGFKCIATVRNMHVTSTAGTSNYWSKKRVEWRREHFPLMKDVYTPDDTAQINM